MLIQTPLKNVCACAKSGEYPGNWLLKLLRNWGSAKKMPKSHHFSVKRMNKNSMESKNNVLSVNSYRVTKILFRRQKRYRDLKSTKFVIATRFIYIAGEPAICLVFCCLRATKSLAYTRTRTYLLYFQLIPVKSSLHWCMRRRVFPRCRKWWLVPKPSSHYYY